MLSLAPEVRGVIPGGEGVFCPSKNEGAMSEGRYDRGSYDRAFGPDEGVLSYTRLINKNIVPQCNWILFSLKGFRMKIEHVSVPQYIHFFLLLFERPQFD